MNISPHNLDSLRKLIRTLQAENLELKSLLDNAAIPYAESSTFSNTATEQDEYDPDQATRIHYRFIDQSIATKFFAMFWGREDVFAKRAKYGLFIRFGGADETRRGYREMCGKRC